MFAKILAANIPVWIIGLNFLKALDTVNWGGFMVNFDAARFVTAFGLGFT